MLSYIKRNKQAIIFIKGDVVPLSEEQAEKEKKEDKENIGKIDYRIISYIHNREKFKFNQIIKST